jgi:putative ABC transport system permease protein
MVILKIAFRNLLEHKVKTAIVGTLIALAVMFMVTGNSILDTIRTGMKQSYSANYTGDLIVHGTSKDSFSLLASGPGAASGSDIPQIPEFQTVRSSIEQMPQVQSVLPLLSGSASISLNEETAGFTMLWGANFDEYALMFPDSLEFTQGGFPEEPGPYILLSESVREAAEKETGKPLHIGDSITLAGFGASGSRLREATIAGFFRFKRGNEQLNLVSLIDANILRSLKGMTRNPMGVDIASSSLGANGTTEAATTDDELFGNGGSLVQTIQPVQSGALVNYDAILGDTSIRNRYTELDPNAWNFLLIRLKDSASIPATQESIQTMLTTGSIDAQVSDWSWGAGTVATLAMALQFIFNIIIAIILVVAIIIIMNTLVISVTERIPEIGTIRAIGAGKGFVRVKTRLKCPHS